MNQLRGCPDNIFFSMKIILDQIKGVFIMKPGVAILGKKGIHGDL